MAGWVLAIDFGTSFTSVAFCDNDHVELVEIDNVRAMPSGVWLDESGSLVVGSSAERQARSAPQRWERSPKRLLGEVAPLLFGGDTVVPVVEAVAAVLKHAAAEAYRRQGGPPDEVRLTFPARWGDRRRGALQAAAQIAGLGPPVVARPPRLIPEPVAAALYFADRGALPAGAQVAVYDLGGGTFDSTVLGADAGGYTVRALGGLDNVGGESFDALLYAHVGKEIERRDESVWATLQEPPDVRWRRAGEDLYREVRRAKEDLSKYPSVTLDTGGLLSQPVQLTRDELESVLRPRIEATARELLETINRAGRRPSDLAAVYLAGGSSRMPLVERVVSGALGATAKVLGEPKSVVVIGAAKWSADVRVDIRPPQPVRPPVEAAPILPTVPAEVPTRIVTPQAPPPPRLPPASTPPPSGPGQVFSPSAPTAPWVPQPIPRVPPQAPPPRRRKRTGVVLGAIALSLIGVIAIVVAIVATRPSSPPGAPANLRSTSTEDAVNLDWDSVSGADHYAVYRDSTAIASDVGLTTYVDRPGDTDRHTYSVTAFSSKGKESARSASVSAGASAGGGPSSPP
ncbi:MAG: Hsp70 family protein, partial [Mycobacteriales bacterium]